MRRVDKCPDGSSAIVTFKLAIIAKKVREDKNLKWNDTTMVVEAAPALDNGNTTFFYFFHNYICLIDSPTKTLWYINDL